MRKSARFTRHPPRQLAGFALVGAVGFAVDGGVLSLLTHVLGLNVYLSRAFSFAAAATVTWLLNRTLVFRVNESPNKERGREYGRYFAVQSVGALVNLGVYSGLVAGFPFLHSVPIIALAIGALFGLIVNYTGSKYWVFRPQTPGSET